MSTSLFPISHSTPLNLIPSSNSLDLSCENNTSSYPYIALSLHNNDSIALPLSVSPSESNIDIISYQEPTNPDPQAPPLEQPKRNIITRSKTGNLKPKYFFGFKMFYYTHHPFHCLTSILTEFEPTSYTQVVTQLKWRQAMGCEFDALMGNGVWSLGPRPHDKHVVRNKWVFEIKRHLDGSIERYKARLMANGFDQKSGIDYFDTFSPVVKSTIIRLILSIAVQFHWPIRQLDVSNVFLHGILDEKVYME